MLAIWQSPRDSVGEAQRRKMYCSVFERYHVLRGGGGREEVREEINGDKQRSRLLGNQKTGKGSWKEGFQ